MSLSRAEQQRKYNASPQGKEVNRKRAAKYRAAHKEYFRAKDKERYQWRKESILRRNEIRRAKLLGAEGSHTLEEWRRVLESVGHICVYCYLKTKIETPVGKLAKDHVVPLAKGGSDYIDNIVPACKSCNSGKSAKSVEVFFGEELVHILLKRSQRERELRQTIRNEVSTKPGP